MCPIVRDAARPLRRPLILQVCLLAAMASLLAAPARAGQFDDLQVKAAFVLNFLKFVTWPETPPAADAPIEVVVLGADDLARAIEQASARQQIGGRSIKVRAVRRAGDIGARRSCCSSPPPSASACRSCSASSRAARC